MLVNRYIRWLRGLVERPGPFYDTLFDIAWEMSFDWSIPNDDNRAIDGTELRKQFESETSTRLPFLGDCRMLEFLVGVAIRMNKAVYDYHDPEQVSDWFWVLIENLKLTHCDDIYLSSGNLYEVSLAFSHLNLRSYDKDGQNGGLFPLNHAKEDQRKVEVWYQMMAYLSENV